MASSKKWPTASGSKYSVGSAPAPAAGPAPPVSSKPAFMPTRSGGGSGFNPLASSRSRQARANDGAVDDDGWGADAPQVTRTQLEKVQPAYQPTKVNMAELTKQSLKVHDLTGVAARMLPVMPVTFVKGGYQPNWQS